ncbi:nitroreductase family protein [bacterium]|nr:MAG: nitroreductase family protein [bacterium]
MCRDGILHAIEERRSVRRFSPEPVGPEILDALVSAAHWAPSGMNNQPWRFVTIEKREVLDLLASFTKYSKILNNCTGAIAVFIDTKSIYHREKDLQSIGAAVQNMLLAAHGLGVGACWLGEILNRRKEVEKTLKVDENLELMAVVAVGFPEESELRAKRQRLPLEKLIAGRF